MKKALFILILIATVSCTKSISQTSNAFRELDESSKMELPYGDKDVLQKFPSDWDSGKSNSSYDSLYNKLSSFIYVDAENASRKTFALDYPSDKSFLSKDFVVSNAVKNKQEKIFLKSAQVVAAEKYKMFSVIYEGNIDCKNCEYPENQIRNVLLTINNGKIVDKLPISYINGSDLARNTRYFFIDSNKVIHIKDFKSDESGVTFTQYLKYKITPEGKFAKQN